MQLEDPIPSGNFWELHCFGIVASMSSIVSCHIRMNRKHLTLSITSYHECSVMQLEDPIPNANFPELLRFDNIASISSIILFHIRMDHKKIKYHAFIWCLCSERTFWHSILLFQVLVFRVAISDWPLLLVGISLYSKSYSPKEAQGMFQNILLAEYHRTSHETPLTKRFILFVNLQNEFGWGRDCVNNLCLNINWCHWLLP